jgi:hypothetical protein
MHVSKNLRLKTSIVLFSSFICGLSHASLEPKTGDTVKFFGTAYSEDGSSILIKEIRIIDYDPHRYEFLVRTTTAIDGTPSRRDEWVPGGDILTSESAGLIVESCREQGGQIEILSVPAGEYNSCRIDSESQGTMIATWYAAVPFGVIKQHTIAKGDEPISSVIELESFESTATSGTTLP